MSRRTTPAPHLRLPVAALCLLALLAAALCMPSTSRAQAPGGFFGVNASGYEGGDFERMADADVGVTRNIFPFEVIRHGKDLAYNWSYTDPIVAGTAENGIDLIDFDEALRGLEAEDEIGARAARVVELRFFCGLGMEEISAVTGSPLRTVERDYKTARLWLQDHLA